MPLPNCNCIGAFTVAEKLTAIYCAFYSAITTPVNLPSCNCVSNYTEAAKLDAIYCAILQFTQQEPAAVNINDVEGVSNFWRTTLGGTPAADQVFGTNGAGVFATFPLGAVGTSLLALGEPMEGDNVIVVSGSTSTYSLVNQTGLFLLAASQGAADGVFVLQGGNTVDVASYAVLPELIAGVPPFTGSQTPVTEISVSNGIVTNAS